MFIRPQTRVQHVMVGDGDNIQPLLIGNKIENVAYVGNAVARGSVHVQIGSSGQVIHRDCDLVNNFPTTL